MGLGPLFLPILLGVAPLIAIPLVVAIRRRLRSTGVYGWMDDYGGREPSQCPGDWSIVYFKSH